jgi:hypothetical protein
MRRAKDNHFTFVQLFYKVENKREKGRPLPAGKLPGVKSRSGG